jgi:hypothetical protein
MDAVELKRLITTRFPDQYKAGLDLTITDVMKMDPEVQRRTFKFLQTGEIEDTEIEGYSIKKLTETGMNPLGAFLMQDWLLRNPEEAIRAMKRGHDSIRPLEK